MPVIPATGKRAHRSASSAGQRLVLDRLEGQAVAALQLDTDGEIVAALPPRHDDTPRARRARAARTQGSPVRRMK
jgi:hypothetical protein